MKAILVCVMLIPPLLLTLMAVVYRGWYSGDTGTGQGEFFPDRGDWSESPQCPGRSGR